MKSKGRWLLFCCCLAAGLGRGIAENAGAASCLEGREQLYAAGEEAFGGRKAFEGQAAFDGEETYGEQMGEEVWSHLPVGIREAADRQPAASRAVQDLLNRVSRYCSTRIQYQFGGQREVLDGDRIVEWILYDSATGTIYLDREKIRQYVAELAEKYDTYQKPREFQTSFGDWVTVTGGSYGWLLDQESESRVLEHLIRSGAKRERVPKFAHTAADWSHSDLGDTYVEVDLTNQHVWLYVDGIQELSADCVTGTYTDEGRKTPSGTYTIYSLMSPAVLKGPDWNSPVSFWMPFNGGIGLHDATWRSSFGGNIFMYSGSHGCVNLPYSAAETIYNYAYSGMPVICYYR